MTDLSPETKATLSRRGEMRGQIDRAFYRAGIRKADAIGLLDALDDMECQIAELEAENKRLVEAIECPEGQVLRLRAENERLSKAMITYTELRPARHRADHSCEICDALAAKLQEAP